MKRLFWLIALLLVPFTASSAPATPNTYEIEVIVFENRLSDLENGELWKPAQEAPAVAPKEESVNFGEKNPAESSLSAARQSLERSGKHRILAHQRWQQSAETKSASKPVQIGAAGELDGALRFYSSRVLIVELNLALKDAPAGAMTTGVPEKGSSIYRLNESRRVKISETHYFDHPKFGALVRIAPVKATASPGAGNQP